MAKILIMLGSVIVLYTLLAKVTGFSELLDFLPVSWFSDILKGQNSDFYKVVPPG